MTTYKTKFSIEQHTIARLGRAQYNFHFRQREAWPRVEVPCAIISKITDDWFAFFSLPYAVWNAHKSGLDFPIYSEFAR